MKKTWQLPFLLFSALAGTDLFADIITLKDGSQITGNTAAGNAREIRIATSAGERSISIDQIQSIRFGPTETVPSVSPLPSPVSAPTAVQSITLPADTAIIIRTIDAIDSKTGDTYKEYAASLDEPVVLNQVTVVPAKANAVLKIAEIKQAGRLKGSTTLSLRLIAVTVDGQRVGLETGDVVSASSGKGRATIRDGAIGTAGGCGIGAAVGGAIGCGVGGAIGAGVGVGTSVLIGKDVKIAPETRLTFKLTQPASIGGATPPAGVQPPVSPEDPVTEALNRGEAHMKADELSEALKEYQKAIDINRRSSQAHYDVAEVFFLQHNYQSAANEFRQAINGDLNPRWLEVWSHIYLGRIFDITGQRERAVNEYSQAQSTRDNTQGAQEQVAKYLREPYQRQNQ